VIFKQKILPQLEMSNKAVAHLNSQCNQLMIYLVQLVRNYEDDPQKMPETIKNIKDFAVNVDFMKRGLNLSNKENKKPS
jgi:hypothetical protein